MALSPAPVGAPENANPFGLPVDERADVVLVTAWWDRWLTAQHPERADEVMRELERRSDLIVGLDGDDAFALGFPPSAFERFAIVLKCQGVYRDRDLYNYVVGPEYSGANWTEKLRPQPSRYRDPDLDKLRLSVPNLNFNFPAIRRCSRAHMSVEGSRMRRRMKRVERLGRDLGETAFVRALGLAGDHCRPLEVHCLTGLTHVQRIEAMQLLEGFSGTRGITLPQSDTVISGRRSGTAELQLRQATGAPRSSLIDMRDELVSAARRFSHERMGRERVLLDLRRHQVAVAPTGHGELTHRHSEVLCSGAALVCQDLSHVEMMLPLEDRVNAAFCRPDLSDLRSTVEELLRDEGQRKRIAKAGRRRFMEWAAGWRAHLYDGIEAHIRKALGAEQAAGNVVAPERDRASASR